jgi:hypothetical protein
MNKNITLVGTAMSLPLYELELDVDNPRLISDSHDNSQADLASTIAIKFEAIEVAKSIARNGFFANEPLIVIATSDSNKWTVVEGNRRLTALLGLAFQHIRDGFYQKEEWEKIAESASLSKDILIPCVKVDDRSQVASIIGFRHISGILDWTPYAQASYIAHLVETEGHNFEIVAEMIGKSRTEVTNLYRNFTIARQASSSGIASTELEGAFSLLTVAMSSPHLRTHISAPTGREVVPTSTPIPVEKINELGELVGWIFGNNDTPALIEDSRQISSLGRVVANQNGLQAIRSGTATTIEAALAAIEAVTIDPIEKIRRHLTASLNALRMASQAIDGDINNSQFIDVLGDLEEELTSIKQLLLDDND